MALLMKKSDAHIELYRQRHYARIVADRKICANDKYGYYHFFKLAWHTIEKAPLVDNFHIKYLCYRLQQEVERIAARKPKTVDLIINIPPRTSKSSITTVFLNAWAWTKYPWMKFITASYSGTLTEKHSIKTKQIIESPWYQERWGHVFQLSRKKNTNKEYWNTEGGMRFATSVKGTVTGDGADIFIEDDLLNPHQSESEAERKTALSFHRDTASSRLNEPSQGVYILVQQRTHAEDVVGAELRDNPEMYDQVILPATDDYAVHPPYLRKFYQNGLLDPVRLDYNTLARIEKKMTKYAGQYGQKPAKPGGNILKPDEWFFRFTMADLYALARTKRKSLVWNFVVDGAYTKKKMNSATVCICFTYLAGRFWIRDVFRDWCSFTELTDTLPTWVKLRGYTPESSIWIEPKANGLDLIDELVVRHGLNAARSYHPTDDKIQAAYSATPTMKAGRVGVLADAAWVKEYYEELENFPDHPWTDQVDTTVMMINNGDEDGSGILASG